MTRNPIGTWAIGGLAWMLAAGGAPAAEPPEEPAPVELRQAVVCPPFKGDRAIAALYHAELEKTLKSIAGIEYFAGVRALSRGAPEFSYRVSGAIVTNEDLQVFVVVTVRDEARREQIASHTAPASLDPPLIASWGRTLRTDIARRMAQLPFECRVARKLGQQSISLDRGLGSGLRPGMVLYISEDEEPLISPVTGETVGRDAPRAAGQIQVFRVMDDTAYARPVAGTTLPRFGKLFARSF